MVQGAVVLGQFPESQVVLFGELVQVLVAHDMVGSGLAHHGDGACVKSGSLGQAVLKRPRAPGNAAA